MARRFNRRRGKKRNGKGLNKKERKQVKQIIERSAEKKFIAFQTGGRSGLANAVFIGKLNYDIGLATAVPILGTGDQQRIGDSIMWDRFMTVNMYVTLNPAATTPHYLRFVIFQWVNNDTSDVPTPAEIFLPGVGGVENYTSQYTEDYKPAYTVLYDKTWNIVNQDLSYQHIIKRIKIKRRKVRFITGTANSSNNSIYYMVMGTGVGTNTAEIFFTAKLKYTDI